MVYVKRSVMVMEPMAEGSLGVREGVERGKLKEGLRARGRGGVLLERKRKIADEEAEGLDGQKLVGNGLEKENEMRQEKKRKIRGPKGPNPLSVKKPKMEKAKVFGSTILQSKREDVHDTTTDAIQLPASIIIEGNSDEPTNRPSKRKRKRKLKPTLVETLAVRDEDSSGSGS